MSSEFEGKVVVVTGASSGIGAATVNALLERGAHVVAIARRLDRLQDVAKQSKHASNCLVLEGDVTRREVVKDLVAKAAAWKGRLDALVNNAGVSRGALHELTSEDDFELMLDTNVLALVNVTRAAIPLLKLSNGIIVNISSTAAKAALPGGAVYSASKAAVATFSEALRKELAPQGIRVVVVYPGLVKTDLFDHFDAAKKEVFTRMIAEIEPLEAWDIAQVITFALAQPAHVALSEIVVRPTRQVA